MTTRKLKQLKTKLRLGLLFAVIALCIGQDQSIISATFQNATHPMETTEGAEAEVFGEADVVATIDEIKKKHRWRALRSTRSMHRRLAAKFQFLPWIQPLTTSSFHSHRTLRFSKVPRQITYNSFRISTDLPRLC